MNTKSTDPTHPLSFYYVRHGQTDWNLEHRAMGQTDIPLNHTGIAQAASAAKLLATVSIGTICYSPLSRARQTAEILQKTLKSPLIEIPELQEFDLGPYQGKIKEQWFKNWREGQELMGTESYQTFLERALKGIHQALSFPGPVLIVAHGGTYWALEKMTLSGRPDIQNCIPIFYESLPTGSWASKILREEASFP